jgi:predicted small lipoprotein YifL
MRRPRRRLRLAAPRALAALAALALAGCGQTGPLYLPDAGGEVVTRPAPTPAPAPAPAPAPDTPKH